MNRSLRFHALASRPLVMVVIIILAIATGVFFRQKGLVEDRTFEIEFLDLGLQAFSFTFG